MPIFTINFFLSIYNSKLTNITSPTLKCLTKLKSLALRSCGIKYIGNDSLCLNSLTSLSLGENQINQFSLNFENCRFSKLTWLSLGGNFLTSITSSYLKWFPSLEILYLSYNTIRYIASDAFSNLTNLNTLYLTNNQLTNLTDLNLEYITSLQTLFLFDNNLVHINCGIFEKLNSLKTLDLSRNQINFISDYAFDNLTSLSFLYLSNNKINNIPQYLFTPSLTSLYYIDLSYNYLTTMELWPTYLPNVMSINLQHNQIGKFTNKFGWAINNQSSQWLNYWYYSTRIIDLQYNSISSFGVNDLQKYGICNISDYQNILVNVFQFFNMNNNLISCNCSNTLYDLQSIYSSYLYQTQCSNPANFAGKSILTYDSCTNLANFVPTNSIFCNQIQQTSTLQISTLQSSVHASSKIKI